jgi:hypothetical protein
MPLEVLNVPLVFFRSGARFKGAQIAAAAGLWVFLS